MSIYTLILFIKGFQFTKIFIPYVKMKQKKMQFHILKNMLIYFILEFNLCA